MPASNTQINREAGPESLWGMLLLTLSDNRCLNAWCFYSVDWLLPRNLPIAAAPAPTFFWCADIAPARAARALFPLTVCRFVPFLTACQHG
jgi:hypothetical protein